MTKYAVIANNISVPAASLSEAHVLYRRARSLGHSDAKVKRIVEVDVTPWSVPPADSTPTVTEAEPTWDVRNPSTNEQWDYSLAYGHVTEEQYIQRFSEYYFAHHWAGLKNIAKHWGVPIKGKKSQIAVKIAYARASQKSQDEKNLSAYSDLV